MRSAHADTSRLAAIRSSTAALDDARVARRAPPLGVRRRAGVQRSRDPRRQSGETLRLPRASWRRCIAGSWSSSTTAVPMTPACWLMSFAEGRENVRDTPSPHELPSGPGAALCVQQLPRRLRGHHRLRPELRPRAHRAAGDGTSLDQREDRHRLALREEWAHHQNPVPAPVSQPLSQPVPRRNCARDTCRPSPAWYARMTVRSSPR